MTPAQIIQLRQLLREAQEAVGTLTPAGICYPLYGEKEIQTTLAKALALLPCLTCNGTKKIYCDECGGACDFKAAGGNYTTICHKCDLHGCIPCPDCQQHSP